MPYIQRNGADLNYEDRGEGRPILFLHGVLHGLRFFERQLTGLSDDYRAIAFDVRGHGRSEKTELGHTIPSTRAVNNSIRVENDIREGEVAFYGQSPFVPLCAR